MNTDDCPAAGAESDALPDLKNFTTHTSSVPGAYKAYDQMRDKCPVFRSEAHGGYHVITRYADVRTVARDWQGFISSAGVNLPRTPEQLPLLEHDPPEHEVWRALFQQALNQDTINQLRPMAETFADELIDEFASAGACDLVSQYTEQLPPMVICSVVGIEAERSAEMRAVAMRLASTQSDAKAFEAELGNFAEFVLAEANARRESPRDDFLSVLANEEVPGLGRRITDGEFVGIMTGFLIAGHETTTAAMSTILANLLPRAEWVAEVREGGKFLSKVIEEGLRVAAPFHGFHRTATRDTDVGGVQIHAGEDVMLCWASANRDPRVFDHPSQFRVDRPLNPHVTFGFGIHACVGAALARMELGVGITRLLDRLPDIQLDRPAGDPEFCGGVVALIPSLPASFSAP